MSNRPKPTAIRKLQGNPGKRPMNDAEPQPAKVAPEKPRGMGKGASREWDRLAPELMSLGVLSIIDGKALASYCESFEVAEIAYKAVRRSGGFIDSPVLDDKNSPIFLGEEGAKYVLTVRKVDPAFTVWVAAKKLMKTFLIEFGLTPASRSKLKIEKAAAEDPMDALLNRNKPAEAPETDLSDIDEESVVN